MLCVGHDVNWHLKPRQCFAATEITVSQENTQNLSGRRRCNHLSPQ
jgi:hypothetical protein